MSAYSERSHEGKELLHVASLQNRHYRFCVLVLKLKQHTFVFLCG